MKHLTPLRLVASIAAVCFTLAIITGFGGIGGSIRKAASTHVRATGVAAVATTIAPGNIQWRIKQLLLTCETLCGGGTLTITTDATSGTNYDCEVYTQATTGITKIVKSFDPPLEFDAYDEGDVAWSNPNTVRYTLDAIWEPVRN